MVSLAGLLAAKFKDRAVLALFGRIIASYETAPGRGLPIGNLTSQHFANSYLAPLDRFLKEDLQRGAYVRYMDDILLVGDDKVQLWATFSAVQDFLQARLALAFKPRATRLAPVTDGLSFLGWRIYPGLRRLQRDQIA